MYRLIVAVACGLILYAGAVVAADEQLIQQFSGNGSRTTRPFTVTDRWEVQWKTDKSIGIFTVDTAGEPVAEIGNSREPWNGSSYQPKGGTFSLQIISGGKWTIKVVQLP